MAPTPTIGLSSYRWNNNIKSMLLLAAFPFLLLLLLSILFYLVAWYVISDPDVMSPDDFTGLGLRSVLGTYGALDLTLAVARGYGGFVIAAAAVWLVLGFLFNDAMIHRATGARAVTHAEAPKLYGLLETLCISRGMRMPRLYIIETDAMNAYASGIDERSYAITVTRGLLNTLNDAELESVLAHELSHIINRDTRLLIVTILFVGVISFIAQLWWRGLSVSSSGSGRDSGGSGGIALLGALIAGVVYLLSMVLRFAISRRREYLADAGSVELTKRPEPLISALRKIARNPNVPHVPSEVRQMFFENPIHGPPVLQLFATHPPIEDRIKVLEEMEGGAPMPFDDSPPLEAPHHAGSVPEAGAAQSPHHGHGTVPDSG